MSYQHALKENLSKLVNFCVVISILKMEENMRYFQHIMLFYFKKGKSTTETHKKRFVQCMEKVLWLTERVKSGLWSFMLKISRWTMLDGQVDQLKLTAIKSRHWEQPMLYYVGDSWRTQTVTGENEKCVLFYRKNHTDFLANPRVHVCHEKEEVGNRWGRILCWFLTGNVLHWLPNAGHPSMKSKGDIGPLHSHVHIAAHLQVC